MTNSEIDKLVEEKVVSMIRGRPEKMIPFLLCQMGKLCVETNAETCDIEAEATVNGGRYKIKAVITANKISE